MMALAPITGRTVATPLGRDRLAALTDPANYLDAAGEMTGRLSAAASLP